MTRNSSQNEEKLAALIAEGRLTPASRPLPKVPPPLVTLPVSASKLVLAERDDDASRWVEGEVMETRIRAARADPGLRRELDELQPDTIADV